MAGLGWRRLKSKLFYPRKPIFAGKHACEAGLRVVGMCFALILTVVQFWPAKLGCSTGDADQAVVLEVRSAWLVLGYKSVLG